MHRLSKYQRSHPQPVLQFCLSCGFQHVNYGAELAYPEASRVCSHECIQFVLDQYVIRTDIPKNEAHLAQTGLRLCTCAVYRPAVTLDKWKNVA